MKRNQSLTIQQYLSEKSNDYTFLQKGYKDVTGIDLFDPFATPFFASHKTLPTISVIIPAWNAKGTILACLSSIEKSSYNFHHQECLQVIVVDDGSTDDMWRIIKRSNLQLNLTAVKIHHTCRAQACNTGTSVANGDILVSCDADMILSFFTLEHFAARYQLLPNAVLIGFRTNTDPTDHRVDTRHISKYGSPTGVFIVGDERLSFPVQGWPNSMSLASGHYKHLGYKRGLWMPDDESFNDPWLLSDQVFGALFSINKDVFFDIGGYDERFMGWGCEDSFLAAKAIAEGQYIIPAYAASGLHISHLPRNGGERWKEYERNRKLFCKLIRSSKVGDCPDWLINAKKRIIESFEQNATQKPVDKEVEKNTKKKLETTLSGLDSLIAIGEYQKVFNLLSERSGEWKNDPAWLLRLARAYSGTGRYQDATRILEDIISINLPPQVIIELAIAKASNGDYLSAQSTLNTLSKTQPNTPGLSYWYKTPVEIHIKQGKKFLNQGFYQVASRCFDAALIVEPTHKTALKLKGQCIDTKSLKF